jgi:hypothetical protein
MQQQHIRRKPVQIARAREATQLLLFNAIFLHEKWINCEFENLL